MKRFFVVIVVNTLLPLLVLAAAAIGVRTLLASREAPQESPRTEQSMLVQVVEVQQQVARPRIRAQGTVVFARQVSLASEVSGRITERHPQLQTGGLVNEGDTLVRVDTASYRIAVREREAELATARANLQLETGRADVARREWELFHEQVPEAAADAPLALRAPQMQNAETAIEAANIRLERAQLDLRRSTITVPFNAIVASQSAEVGQLAGPGAVLATLTGTDEFWVQVLVPSDLVAHLQVPDASHPVGGPATIRWRQGDRVTERTGTIVRLLPDVDPVGRMARVLVSVNDPLLLRPESEALRASGAQPLLLGSWVDVEFEGKESQTVVALPRVAFRDGAWAWVMLPDNTLDVREVQVAWSEADSVLVSEGLRGGERVVVSYLEAPVTGTALRTAEEGSGTVAPSLVEGEAVQPVEGSHE
jgi:RND family efflux transporter MFP subunit